MKLSTVDKLITLASKIMYVVVKKRTSLDRAFQEVVKGRGRREYSKVPHALLYRLCRNVARDYIAITHYLTKFAKRRRLSMRLVIKAWIALKGDELFDEAVVRSVRKKLALPHQSIEEAASEASDEVERMVLRYSFPRWFVKELLSYFGNDECERMLSALNKEVLWIRVNTLKNDIDRIVKILESRGMVIEADKELPYMLKVKEFETPIQYIDLVRQCDIVLQDKASAIAVEELDPEPNDVVLDVAAAPGIKTSLIMQLTENRARVVAVDVSRERVARMRRLLRCLGVDIDRIDIVVGDSTKGFVRGCISKALVDAPCSGSGTVGRDPATKIHLVDRGWVLQLINIQRSMLGAALATAETTLYAVCSVLPSEAEENVAAYSELLQAPRFRGAPGLLGLGRRVSRFYPHIHGTHGFFIAKLCRGAQIRLLSTRYR
ncbi:MAG: RsmB/NOP family class I SAM-dependent RNA methyltransferase [Crenarchaeota archaeon]|nr:RsmB/NOP family class I SAM-dependent RNA methyltransferase [Thermoproteota archaeon]